MKCALIKDESIYFISASVMLVICNSTKGKLADMFINILYLSGYGSYGTLQSSLH
jgi:hypothetical protein